MDADGRYGVGMRRLVLTPGPWYLSSFAGEPALSLSKRGDQRRARGRSNAVQAMLARMFCPPLNGGGWGRGWPVRAFRGGVAGKAVGFGGYVEWIIKDHSR